ncbi:chromate efflux transporter [Algiphilus sp.]|uniref:chromate efflux transporter n=1 Tax=Algiphilus sp. TaxID=1872431 RepID=UPI002A60025B|nr:chromate efflux transporter [Pseudomonadota bacterium]
MHSWRESFIVFLRLGLTAFGGPVAHLAYFRETFVVRRQWLSEAQYAELVALCQFLPGPASSQVAMAIGHHRAGAPGMLAAWCAFTLPSAIALLAFAWLALPYAEGGTAGWLIGIKAAVVAVVAHALVSMGRSLLPTPLCVLLAAGACLLILLSGGLVAQLVVIVGAAAVGWLLLDRDRTVETAAHGPPREERARPLAWLLVFLLLLLGLPWMAAVWEHPWLAVADRFYRTGSLVFGGGHVVLPLLHGAVVETGWVSATDFLAGYAAAQAIPGPLFSVAAYLGAVMQNGGLLTAIVALAAIFLPSALLLLGILPLWHRLRQSDGARRAMTGVGAGVVGLLAAAWWHPVLQTGVQGPVTGAMALLGFGLLWQGRTPAWTIVLGSAAVGALLL